MPGRAISEGEQIAGIMFNSTGREETIAITLERVPVVTAAVTAVVQQQWRARGLKIKAGTEAA